MANTTIVRVVEIRHKGHWKRVAVRKTDAEIAHAFRDARNNAGDFDLWFQIAQVLCPWVLRCGR